MHGMTGCAADGAQGWLRLARGVARAIRAWVAVFAASALIAAPAAAFAQEDRPLLFAGFAFSGDAENVAQRYPHSAALAERENRTYLDRLLRDRLARRSALAGRVQTELAANGRDPAAVAFALVQEDVETQMIEGRHWVIVTLQANVLAFDKASRMLVASHPLRLRSTQVLDAAPTEAEKRELVRQAYENPDARANVLELWLDKLEKVRVREGARKYLRVTDVALAPEAEAVVGSPEKARALRGQVANYLEAAVAEHAGISLVPNTVGEAIGNKMLSRFANGAELQLTLPEPDYALSFRVRDFVSRTIEKPEYLQDIFRVKGSVAIRQPELQKVVLEEDVYDTRIVTRPRRADVRLVPWDQYAKTLERLVFSVGRQMVNVDETWLKENASRGAAARTGFLNAGQVLKELM